jgi:peptide/nickel transport system substrate-binding protein
MLKAWPGLSICFKLPLLLLIFGVSGIAGTAHSETFTIGVGRDFYDGSDSRSFLHGSTNTWEGLTYLDQNMRAIPWLAESWQSSDDGRQWTFYMRKGVRFHDGTPVTNTDVVFCIERMISHPKYDIAGNYRSVTSVKAEGDRAIVFSLKEPVPYFPNLTAYYSSPVIKPSCIESDGRIRELIATGPYKVKAIRPGDSIELEAFDEYRGQKPAYDRVIFKTIIDAQSRLMALMAGEIDAVADVGGILPEQASLIQQYPDLILKQVQVATTHLLVFNSRIHPFSERENRQWFAGELNRSQLINIFAKGAGKEAFDSYSPLCHDFAFGLIRPESRPFPGFKSQSLEILLSSSTLQRWPYLEMAQVIQQMLRGYGLSSEIRVLEIGAYHDAVKKGNFHIALQPYTLMSGDPDFFYAYWIESDAPRNCGWKDPQTDNLIRSARHEMNFSNRQALYRKLTQTIHEQLPVLPIYHDVSLYACSKRFQEFEMDHLFKPCLVEKKP